MQMMRTSVIKWASLACLAVRYHLREALGPGILWYHAMDDGLPMGWKIGTDTDNQKVEEELRGFPFSFRFALSSDLIL